MPKRTIIHLNISHFETQIAEVIKPTLRGRPLAVVDNSTILAISEEAWKSGVRQGMPLQQGRRQCGDLTPLDPQPQYKLRATTAIRKKLLGLTHRVEPAGPGHFFVDISGSSLLYGDPRGVCHKIEKELKSEYRLSSGLGLSSNKMVSKIATRVSKPGGIQEIIPGEEASFLSELSPDILPGLDVDLLRILKGCHIDRIGLIQMLSRAQLVELIGVDGGYLQSVAAGQDPSPVYPYSDPPPEIYRTAIISPQTGGSNEMGVLQSQLRQMVSCATTSLRQVRLGCGCLLLGVEYADGVSCERAQKNVPPLLGEKKLQIISGDLLRKMVKRRVRVITIHIYFPSFRCVFVLNSIKV